MSTQDREKIFPTYKIKYHHVFTLASHTLNIFARFINTVYIFKGRGMSLGSADRLPVVFFFLS